MVLYCIKGRMSSRETGNQRERAFSPWNAAAGRQRPLLDRY